MAGDNCSGIQFGIKNSHRITLCQKIISIQLIKPERAHTILIGVNWITPNANILEILKKENVKPISYYLAAFTKNRIPFTTTVTLYLCQYSTAARINEYRAPPKKKFDRLI